MASPVWAYRDYIHDYSVMEAGRTYEWIVDDLGYSVCWLFQAWITPSHWEDSSLAGYIGFYAYNVCMHYAYYCLCIHVHNSCIAICCAGCAKYKGPRR